MSKSDRVDAIIILLLFTLIVGGLVASRLAHRVAAPQEKAAAANDTNRH